MNNEELNKSENSPAILLAAGKALGEVVEPSRPYRPYAIIPEGYRMETLEFEALPPLPDHIHQRVYLKTEESFVSYVKKFRTHTTMVFGVGASSNVKSGESGASFTAYLDYHEGGRDQKPSRVNHMASFEVGFSSEFRAWAAYDVVALAQGDFINFIEQNSRDVVSPDSATLMEVIINFESHTSVQFRSKVDRVTGGRSLTFEEKIEAGSPSVGKIKVPDALKIKIPVFEGGREYEFNARMEYRPRDGQLRVVYHLHRPFEVVTKALEDMKSEIEGALETEILIGVVMR